jgi:enoyl-CoA hydratase/carnithine racemase
VWEEIAGTARAKWLLWTGEQIDARTALAWGVVSEVVPHERAVSGDAPRAARRTSRRG